MRNTVNYLFPHLTRDDDIIVEAYQAYLDYSARKLFRDFIEEYGAELAPYKLSEILENEKQRVQQ